MARVDIYKGQIEEFAHACLQPYINAITDTSWRPPSTKELNDCVWQTVVLRPFEFIHDHLPYAISAAAALRSRLAAARPSA